MLQAVITMLIHKYEWNKAIKEDEVMEVVKKLKAVELRVFGIFSGDSSCPAENWNELKNKRPRFKSTNDRGRVFVKKKKKEINIFWNRQKDISKVLRKIKGDTISCRHWEHKSCLMQAIIESVNVCSWHHQKKD